MRNLHGLKVEFDVLMTFVVYFALAPPSIFPRLLHAPDLTSSKRWTERHTVGLALNSSIFFLH